MRGVVVSAMMSEVGGADIMLLVGAGLKQEAGAWGGTVVLREMRGANSLVAVGGEGESVGFRRENGGRGGTKALR